MEPSSLRISQMTPLGCRPAREARSDRGFGVAGALEHATRTGEEREDVAGLHERLGLGGSGSARIAMVFARS